jgi:hypothetical protein
MAAGVERPVRSRRYEPGAHVGAEIARAAGRSAATGWAPLGSSASPPQPAAATTRKVKKLQRERFRFVVIRTFTPSGRRHVRDASYGEEAMTANTARQARGHTRHTVVVIHALRQRAGVPYEVERTVCTDCRRVLDERQLRRAAA